MKYLVFFLTLLFSATALRSQETLWTNGIKGTGEVYPLKSIVNDLGDIYIYGRFDKSITYPVALTSATSPTPPPIPPKDLFLAKYDKNGNFKWIRQIGSPNTEQASGMVLDNSGNIIITGRFRGTCNFNGGTLSSTSNTDVDIFIAKYNPEGTLLNYKNVGSGSSNQGAQGLAIDKNGDLVLIGFFQTSISFGVDSQPLTESSNSITNFIAKFTPDLNLIWAKKIVNTTSTCLFYSISCSDEGYYISASLIGAMNLDIATVESKKNSSNAYSNDILLYKTNYSGEGQWYTIISGTGEDVNISSEVDKLGNAYVTGYFNSKNLEIETKASAIFPSVEPKLTVSTSGLNDIFFAKYNSAGVLQWYDVKGSSTGDDRINQLFVREPLMVIAGQFGGKMEFNNESLEAKGGVDALAVVHDENDNVLYAFSEGGSGADAAQSCVIDNEGNYIFIGDFLSPSIFDSPFTLSNTDPGKDMFIAKYKARSVSLNVTPIKCNAKGSVTANPKGAWIAAKTFKWSKQGDNSFSAATELISDLSAGTYTCVVSDGTYSETASVTLVDPTLPSISETLASHKDVSCFGGANGAFTVNGSGGNGDLAYLCTGNGTGIVAANNIQTNLSAGTYSATVTDEYGCSATLDNIVIKEPGKFTFKGTEVIPINGGSGSVTLIVNGGTTPFKKFEWSGPVGFTPPDPSTQNLINLNIAGNYSVVVTDQSDCKADTTVVIADSHNLYATISKKIDVSCLNGTDGALEVTPHTNNTAAIFEYLWSGPNGFSATTSAISNLNAGLYSVTVKDIQPIPAVVYTISDIEITQPATSVLAQLDKQDISCFGLSNGVLDANANGGTLPYTYKWEKDGAVLSSVAEVISDLGVGDYSVTVSDANNCKSSATAKLTQPSEIILTGAIVTDVSCDGGKNDGTITLNVSGDKTPFTYTWSNGVSNNEKTLSLLGAGMYSCTITDANGCSISTVQTVKQPAPISAAFVNTNVSCFGGSNGQVNLTAAGGNTPYSYSWSNSALTEDLTGLSAGTYDLTITDSKNCQKSFSTSITEPTDVVISLSSSQNVSCNGASDGSISLNATGGASPYIWSWDDGKTGASISGLSAKSYTVELHDANSCIKTGTYTITEPTALVLTEVLGSHVNVLCNGNSTGQLEVTASGSSGSYEYSIDGATWQASGVFSNLAGKEYSVEVRDLNTPTCKKSSSITISQPNSISFTSVSKADISCNNLSDGKLIAPATGGTAPLAYTLKLNGVAVENTSGASDGNFTGLAAGTGYTVEVTDANNCTPSVTSSTDIINPEPISVKTFTTTDVTCAGAKNGIVNVEAQGGVSAYVYTLLLNGAATANESGKTTGSFTGIEPGTDYSVEVTDANSCPVASTAKFTLTDPKAIAIDNVSSGNITCNGLKDGSINISASGGTGSLKYVLKIDNTVSENVSGISTGAFTGCGPGTTYVVEVTDDNNCTPVASSAITISEPQAIVIGHAQATNATGLGLSDGMVNIIASGGTGELLYSLNSGTPQASGSFVGLPKGEYTVSITDANSCAVTSSQLIVDAPTSVDLLTGGIVKLFPNPVAEKVFIEVKYVEYDNLKVELKNIAGQAALVQEFENVESGFKASIDVTHLPKGIYIVVINNRVIKEKLVIQ